MVGIGVTVVCQKMSVITSEVWSSTVHCRRNCRWVGLWRLLLNPNILGAPNKGMQVVKPHSSQIFSVLSWACWLMQIVLCRGCKMVIVVVLVNFSVNCKKPCMFFYFYLLASCVCRDCRKWLWCWYWRNCLWLDVGQQCANVTWCWCTFSWKDNICSVFCRICQVCWWCCIRFCSWYVQL